MRMQNVKIDNKRKREIYMKHSIYNKKIYKEVEYKGFRSGEK